jgi:hypothetical protein
MCNRQANIHIFSNKCTITPSGLAHSALRMAAAPPQSINARCTHTSAKKSGRLQRFAWYTLHYRKA